MKKISTSDVISYAIKYVQCEINKCEDILHKPFSDKYQIGFIISVRDNFFKYKSHLTTLFELQADCLKRGV